MRHHKTWTMTKCISIVSPNHHLKDTAPDLSWLEVTMWCYQVKMSLPSADMICGRPSSCPTCPATGCVGSLGANCKLCLIIVRQPLLGLVCSQRILSVCKMIGMDGRKSCRHLPPTSFLACCQVWARTGKTDRRQTDRRARRVMRSIRQPHNNL